MTKTQTISPRVRCDDCYTPTFEEAVIDYISVNRLSGEDDLTDADMKEIAEKVRTQLENDGGTYCTDHWAAAAE